MKFHLNFGFLHSNGDVIFPYDDGNDGKLHEISSPGGIFIEKILRVPSEHRDDFKIVKTIICQIKFVKVQEKIVKNAVDSSTLCAYEKIFSDEILTDCTIECENGEIIKAHKFMLAAQSFTFQTILEKSNEIIMQNVQHTVAKEMIRFLYSREINDCRHGNFVELLKVAHEVNYCSFHFLSSTFTR